MRSSASTSSRRSFLAASAGLAVPGLAFRGTGQNLGSPASAGLSTGQVSPRESLSPSALSPSALSPSDRRRAPRKAVKLGMVQLDGSLLDKLKLLKACGFDGVEPSAPAGWDPVELRAASEETGIEVHGLVGSKHWQKPLSSADEKVRNEGREALEEALRLAPQVGASTVLLVPAVVSAEVSYLAAWERSIAEIRKVLPLCAELGVQIALENVWNNFLLSPLEAALYIDTLNDGADPVGGRPPVGMYFDAGNLVRYGWPLHWVEALGERILKVDVKDYSRDKQMNEGPWKGFGVGIGEGDTGWPEVVEALAEIGYDGWYTAEVSGGDEARLRQIAERMDAFLKR